MKSLEKQELDCLIHRSIIFKDKTIYGPEVYYDFDFSKDRLVFCVRPKYLYEIDSIGSKTKILFVELFEITNIFYINTKTKRVYNIESNSYCYTTKIYRNEIAYCIGIDILLLILNLIKKRKNESN